MIRLATIALCILMQGLFSASQGLTKLYDLKGIQDLSETLFEVVPNAKLATVCIELDDGSSGSGVIVSPDGLILSAAHVTQAVGKDFEVVFEDGTRYPAVGLGLNTTSDASMAKITLPDEETEFPYVPISTHISPRQYVFSLGHSGGFDADRGLVLRLGRIIEISDNSMTTDCTLIGGDSGGPLFDLKGRLIGIHSRVGQITSSNTHIPMDDFKKHWNDLEAGKLWGDGTFADAGLLFQGMRLLQNEEQLTVVEIKSGSNAEKAGILTSDILLSVNGVKIDSLMTLLETLAHKKSAPLTSAGIPIEVSRDGVITPLTLSTDE